MNPSIPQTYQTEDLALRLNLKKKLEKTLAKFSSVTAGDERRQEIERYIAQQFKQQYDATITSFLPKFVVMDASDSHDVVSPFAAVGLRKASCESLFLEQYLTRPVEQEISHGFHLPIDRQKIVEIGNLVSTRRGGSYLLFAFLARVLHLSGMQWMIFTATEQVESIINKMGYVPLVLCEASSAQVENSDNQWGRYYSAKPRVMAGNLELANDILESSEFFQLLLEPFYEDLQQIAGLLAGSN